MTNDIDINLPLHAYPVWYSGVLSPSQFEYHLKLAQIEMVKNDNNFHSQVAPVSEQSTKPSQDQKQWDCSFCGKKFTTKYFLKKHIRLHTGCYVLSWLWSGVVW